MRLAVNLLVNASNANISCAICEVSSELASAFNRNEKNFAVDDVPAGDVEVRELQVK